MTGGRCKKIICSLLCAITLQGAAMAQNDVEDVIMLGNVPLAIKFVAHDSEMRDNGVVAVNGWYFTRYEITQEQWLQLMTENPSATKGDKLPVTNMTADSAEAFCQKLDKMLVFGVHLPLESEWRFAASGGLYPEHYRYCGSNTLRFVGWHKENSGGRLHPVGTLVANELGIHDFSGNAGELVNGSDGAYKVMGGNYNSKAAECTSGSTRPYTGPENTTGLRVCWPITLYF